MISSTLALYKNNDGSFTLMGANTAGEVMIFAITEEDAMRLAWAIFTAAGEEEEPGLEIEEEEDDA